MVARKTTKTTVRKNKGIDFNDAPVKLTSCNELPDFLTEEQKEKYNSSLTYLFLTLKEIQEQVHRPKAKKEYFKEVCEHVFKTKDSFSVMLPMTMDDINTINDLSPVLFSKSIDLSGLILEENENIVARHNDYIFRFFVFVCFNTVNTKEFFIEKIKELKKKNINRIPFNFIITKENYYKFMVGENLSLSSLDFDINEE